MSFDDFNVQYAERLAKLGINLNSPDVREAFAQSILTLSAGEQAVTVEQAVKAVEDGLPYGWRKGPEHMLCMALRHHWEPKLRVPQNVPSIRFRKLS